MADELLFRHALLPTGWSENVRLTVVDGLIARVEAGVPGGSGIALPGMPNLHSHAFQRAMAGHAERRGPGQDSFWTWRTLMYRLALGMTPEDVETAATLAFIEMLEGGFTAVAEFHYLHHAPDGAHYDDIGEMAARLAAAATTTGIDFLILPVFYAHAGFGGAPPQPEQRRFLSTPESYARLLERCRTLAPTGVAPHSLRAVTGEELAQLVMLAGQGPFHIHIAEQVREVEDCLAWCGQRPVAHLLDTALVGPNWCLVHATHISPEEGARLGGTGAVVGLCPITEANLGDGIFPTDLSSALFGIGSDSNILIDAGRELQMLEYAQRLARRQRNVMAAGPNSPTATALYTAALEGGARAMGIRAELAVGAPANFVAIDGVDPDLALAQAVFCARAPATRDVWVRGRQLVSAGRHPLRDRAAQKFAGMVARLI